MYDNQTPSPERQADFRVETWGNQLAQLIVDIKNSQKLADPQIVGLFNQTLQFLTEGKYASLGNIKDTSLIYDRCGTVLAKLIFEIQKNNQEKDPQVLKLFQEALRIVQTPAQPA